MVARLFFFNVETRDRNIANIIGIGFANLSRANLHAPLGNRCSDMFAFPHFLRKLSNEASKINFTYILDRRDGYYATIVKHH